MIIVSDTSPIANLLIIKRLDLLAQLFQSIIIPPAVDRELKKLGDSGEDISAYIQSRWIIVKAPADMEKVQQLRAKLDPGESEAIALAEELQANYLLIDERAGTRVAKASGLQTIGLLGVLIKAKEQQLIQEVKPVMQELRSKAGFYVGQKVFDEVLAIVGED